MFVVLILAALAIGAVCIGCYLQGEGKLGKYVIRGILGAVLLMNPITGPICWTIVVIAACIFIWQRIGAGVVEMFAGRDGDRL